MFTLVFWRAALERSVSTFAQVFITLAAVTNPLNLIELNWGQIFIASGISAGLAVVKSLAVATVTDGSPSAVSAEKLVGTTPPPSVEYKNGSLAG